MYQSSSGLQVLGVGEGLQGSTPVTVFATVRAFCLVIRHPLVEVCLKFIERCIDFLAEGDVVKFFFDGAMEAFTDTVGLRMVSVGSAVVNIFNRQVELILVGFDRAVVFRASVRQDPQ
jgi:hypothetical protein